MTNKIEQALVALPDESTVTVTVGFDGYIDTIIRVVEHSDVNGETYFKTMKCFGNYVAGKSHKSCSLELKVIKEKSGGNMPIFSKALSKLDVNVNCIGAMGYPTILPIFDDISERCKLFSVSNPGTCQALEFEDGKLMLACNEDIEKLNYDILSRRLGISKMVEIIEQSDMITFLNWSELKGSTSIWKGILKDVYPLIKSNKNMNMFIDLSDCSHRSNQEILEMLGLINEYSKIIDVSISLNLNEAEKLISTLEKNASDITEILIALSQSIKCKVIIIHLVNSSYCINDGEIICNQNKYIEKPKLLTGGGDNFNAGFVFSYLNGFDIYDALTIANAVSGYYVSHGHSPTKQQLATWIAENDYITL